MYGTYPRHYGVVAPIPLWGNSDVTTDRAKVHAEFPAGVKSVDLILAADAATLQGGGGTLIKTVETEAPVYGTNIARFEIFNLAPDTLYFATFRHRGVQSTAAGDIMRFRTIPEVPRNGYRIIFGSCIQQDGNHVILDRIETRNPDRLALVGDWGYGDLGLVGSDIDGAYYSQWRRIHRQSKPRRLMMWFATKYTPSDHDMGGNNIHGLSPGATSFKRTYRYLKAQYGIPTGATDPVYSTELIGDLRCIYSDVRTERSPNTDTDDSAKKLMMTTQLAWWQNLITNSGSSEKAILNFFDMNLLGAAVASQDDFRGFTNHRQFDIYDHLIAQGKNGKWYFFCGDGHWYAIDNGTNAKYGSDSSKAVGGVMMCSPMDQNGVNYPGFTVSHGSGNEAPSSGPYNGFFGRLDFTVSGGVTTTMDQRIERETSGGSNSTVASRTGIAL